MAIPIIAVAAAAFVENAPASIAALTTMSLTTLMKNKEYIKESFYNLYYDQLMALNNNDPVVSVDNSATNPEKLTDYDKMIINSITSEISRTGKITNGQAEVLNKYGIQVSVGSASSGVSSSSSSNASVNNASVNNASVSSAISSVKSEISSLQNDISSIHTAIAAMNEYYASQDSLNSAISALRSEIASIRNSASSTPTTSTGGLIGAIALSTAKLDAISQVLTALNTSTQNIASKTGTFSGNLRLTNAKDISQSVSVSAPDVKVSPVVAPNITATVDMSKPMTINGFSDLVSVQTGLKALEDARVKREEAAVEIEKARVKREEEAHDILKEKTDFLTKPRVIRDMDGNELANAIPREMALTHQASLARTYTDENTLTSDDIDFGNFDLEIPEFFKTLKPGLATDIILNSDINNT
ncbi:hypothetical protein [Campylobacter hyointestinalis]|uniref:hypothetical protein n=1 Tax=Campylobacter hyointestinalis TaxID=198 RepID=UPI0007245149|nr:hypothetical protein [Campylobacter hyointestinalis]CUU75175.1 Uncharacterised protein [Campylobacter hyointestinalis subsp. hyointestinalis]